MIRKDKNRVIQSEYMKETSVFSKWHEFTKGVSSSISETIYEPIRNWNLSRKNAREERERRASIIRDEYDFGSTDQVTNTIDFLFKNNDKTAGNSNKHREEEFNKTGYSIFNKIRSKMDDNVDDDYKMVKDKKTLFYGYTPSDEKYYDKTKSRLKENTKLYEGGYIDGKYQYKEKSILS